MEIFFQLQWQRVQLFPRFEPIEQMAYSPTVVYDIIMTQNSTLLIFPPPTNC